MRDNFEPLDENIEDPTLEQTLQKEQDLTEDDEINLKLFNTVDLGQAAHEFVNSQIGRALLQYAEEDITEASLKLVNVDPTDVGQILALQRRAGAAQLVLEFLNDALCAGDQAYAQLAARTATPT